LYLKLNNRNNTEMQYNSFSLCGGWRRFGVMWPASHLPQLCINT